MNWIEYVRVLQTFRARFGQMPPSILTEDGALDQIQAALDDPSGEKRAAGTSGAAARQRARRPRAPNRREQGH